MSSLHALHIAVFICLALVVSSTNYRRTIVAIAKTTENGQYMFLRGGGINGIPIPIFHNVSTRSTDSVYALTAPGDATLNWKVKEAGQGTYRDEKGRDVAKGTPLMWTTNNPDHVATVKENGYGYTPLNYQGEPLWMVDFYMDCDMTNGGWFDFKGYLVDFRRGHVDPRWEKPFIQTSCLVDGKVKVTSGVGWDARNHHGMCGSFNFVFWSDERCFVDSMEQYLLPYLNEPTEDTHDLQGNDPSTDA